MTMMIETRGLRKSFGDQVVLDSIDLHHLSRSEGRKRAAELLDRFDLVDAAKKTPATYSGGMRRLSGLTVP